MNLRKLSFRAPPSVIALCGGLAVVGGAALAVGLLQSPERAWLNLLLVSYGLLSLGLGGLVFVALQYITGTGWSVALRRVPEAMAAILPVAALCLLVVFLARPSLYPWAGAAATEARVPNPLRDAWFTWPFFLGRAVFYIACWMALGYALVHTSHRQDHQGNRRQHAGPLLGRPGQQDDEGDGPVQDDVEEEERGPAPVQPARVPDGLLRVVHVPNQKVLAEP